MPVATAPTPPSEPDYIPIDDVTTISLRCPACGGFDPDSLVYYGADWHRVGDMGLDPDVARVQPDARDTMRCSALTTSGEECLYRGPIQEFIDNAARPGSVKAGHDPAHGIEASAPIQAALPVAEAAAEAAEGFGPAPVAVVDAAALIEPEVADPEPAEPVEPEADDRVVGFLQARERWAARRAARVADEVEPVEVDEQIEADGGDAADLIVRAEEADEAACFAFV